MNYKQMRTRQADVARALDVVQFIADEVLAMSPEMNPDTASHVVNNIVNRLPDEAFQKFDKHVLHIEVVKYLVIWMRGVEYDKLIKLGRLAAAPQDTPSNPNDLASTKEALAGPRPPFDAEFILHMLLRDDERDALIGCLVERYGRIVERFGQRRADIWFYYEVGRTAWPLVRRCAVKAIKFVALGEWIRRMIQ